jgi:hypothetical protein
MKVTAPRIIVIQDDDQKPIRFTDPGKAAEYWARAKADEWVENHKKDAKYTASTILQRKSTLMNGLHDDSRIRYRKLKRRALRIFREIMK